MKRFIAVFLFVAGADIFALDAQFAKIVNTTITDIKTKTDLPSLKGHVSVNVSSGNGDLDKQFLAAILESFPNFTATSESVDEEDVYLMAVRVFRTAGTVTVSVIVTDHQDNKTVDRRIPIGTVDNKLLPTIRYESEVRARTEFDAYLDSVFADLGPPQNANYTPKEPYDWSWLTNFFSRVAGFFVDGVTGFSGGFKLKGYEAYLVKGGYSFTDNSWFVSAFLYLPSGGIFFENGIGISTDILRMYGDGKTHYVAGFPIEVSWTFMEVWGFPLAVYDRIGLLAYGTNYEWAPSNYIGLRMNRRFSYGDVGVFAETNLKTFSLGISAGLGGEWFF
jgi:hypothetical protein